MEQHLCFSLSGCFLTSLRIKAKALCSHALTRFGRHLFSLLNRLPTGDITANSGELSPCWLGVSIGDPGVQIICPQANPFSSVEAIL